MVESLETHPSPSTAGPRGRELLILSIAAMGVVFGDIGTSPLYAMRECFSGPLAVNISVVNVLGVLSLIFWALVLIISVKYMVFVLRADNQGEGGILALVALMRPTRASSRTQRQLFVALGLFGAALLYADGMITPAITVLGAVEGLSVATRGMAEQYIELIAVIILIVLFAFQSQGTTRVGTVFGPILLLWFLTIGGMGLWRLAQHPHVIWAIHPFYAVDFFSHNGWYGFVVLGSVFLVVTGGEALYADLGHFGKRPIRLMWFTIALPALLLNYFGQGAYLLRNPAGVRHPFYEMAPGWAQYPLVILATAAAVIASQAIITGAYSLTLQAIQLGYSPRLTIRHTSSQQMGQIHLPAVTRTLGVACIALVLGFHSSSNLAAAYGVAITTTMVVTTILFYLVLRNLWKWFLPLALLVTLFFLAVDLTFFAANITKIAHGGWFPLAVGAAVFTLMSTWQRGRQLLGAELRERLIPLELFLAQLLSDPPVRVPGTAVFMSGNPVGTPPALRHNVLHNKILHSRVVIVVVETAQVPHVPDPERLSLEVIGEGFWRVIVTYGFMEQPDIPRDLAQVKHPELEITVNEVSYFLGRETVVATKKPGMARWRERLFAWMSRNAQPATQFFRLPPEQVFEVGVQVEL